MLKKSFRVNKILKLIDKSHEAAYWFNEKHPDKQTGLQTDRYADWTISMISHQVTWELLKQLM